MRRRHDVHAVTGSPSLDRRLGADTLGRLINLWEWLRTSLWFVPTIMLALAAAAVQVLGWLDRLLQAGAAGDRLPLLYRGEAVEALALLEALVASMITMVSLVFSIAMVVLTLAASQFGSRLIRSFMADPGTQLFLGAFVAGITYGLLVLVGLRPDEAVPRLSVTAAIAAALGTVFLLLFFMHRVSRSIVAETIIQRVGVELDEAVDRLPPVDDGSKARAGREGIGLPADFAAKARAVALRRTGYVQAVEYERLVRLAARSDLLLVLSFRAGDHVVADGCRVFAYPGDRCPPDLEASIDRLLLIGPNRTPTQDIEFSIRHLVEIALRALSPALNDPYTAVAVIDRLGASLAALMGRALPSAVHCDGEGRPRVIGRPPTYRGIFAAAFHQIRQSGCAHPAVVIRLLNTIERIAEHVRLDEQRRILTEHLRIVAEDGIRCAAQDADAADIRRARAAAERPLLRPPGAPPEDRAIAEWFS